MKQFLLAVAVVSGLALVGHDRSERLVTAQTGLSGAVKKLLTERRDTFRAIEELIRRRHEGGTVGPEEVVRASLPRLDAELELANSAQARLALREKQVQVARKLEEFVIRRFEVETVTELEVLHARAMRLKVEVALEREKNQVE